MRRIICSAAQRSLYYTYFPFEFPDRLRPQLLCSPGIYAWVRAARGSLFTIGASRTAGGGPRGADRARAMKWFAGPRHKCLGYVKTDAAPSCSRGRR